MRTIPILYDPMGVADFYNVEDHRPAWCDVCGDYHVDAGGGDCDRV